MFLNISRISASFVLKTFLNITVSIGRSFVIVHPTGGINTPSGGGVLPSKRLLGMCRWMGSHFHSWTDYNGVTFLVELLEWGRIFSGFLG